MKVIIFGATGMVGRGVLRECLADPEITSVLSVSRGTAGQTHEKLKEIIHGNFEDFSVVESQLLGYDACLFCLGISSAGMSEKDYRHVTYDYAMAVGSVLAGLNPGMNFLFISGAGTDSSEKGNVMWARVKGETENALLKLPFKASYMLRPAYIQPLDGIVSRQALYRMIYSLMGVLYPLWKLLFPKYVITTRELGRGMLRLAKEGSPKKVLESWEIKELALKV